MDRLDYIYERDNLMKADVTLDGRKAYISGRLNKFATVWVADDFSIQADFAWPIVEQVVLRLRGAFRSSGYRKIEG